MPFRPLDSVLNPGSGPLAQLRRHARRIAAAQERLAALLPVEMARHVRVANLSSTGLTLVADGPGWGTRLRFLEPKVLAMLATDPAFAGVERLKIRVRSGPAPASQRRAPTGPIGPHVPHAGAALTAVADAENDPRLAISLRRLAARLSGADDHG